MTQDQSNFLHWLNLVNQTRAMLYRGAVWLEIHRCNIDGFVTPEELHAFMVEKFELVPMPKYTATHKMNREQMMEVWDNAPKIDLNELRSEAKKQIKEYYKQKTIKHEHA